jgi:hypothetical protein
LDVTPERIAARFSTTDTGWRAARAFGIATGGWMPLGILTEEGPRPEFAALFGAVEIPTPDYRARTKRNVADSATTLRFADAAPPGARATLGACDKLSWSCWTSCPGPRLDRSRSPCGPASDRARGPGFKSRRPDYVAVA